MSQSVAWPSSPSQLLQALKLSCKTKEEEEKKEFFCIKNAFWKSWIADYLK